MAHKPSIRNVLAEFGLKFKKTSSFLRKYHGFIRGEALATEFFGRSLEEPQALVLNIYVENPQTSNDEVAYYEKVNEQFNDILACFKTNTLETSDLLEMSLDTATQKLRGVYYQTTTETSDDRFVSVDIFQNEWTGRTIRMHYYWNLADTCQGGQHKPCHPSSFQPTSDLDGFWWAPMFGLPIAHNHCATKLCQLRHNFDKFTLATSSSSPTKSSLPGYSFWQDIHVSTEDLLEEDAEEQLIKLQQSLGLDFAGTDVEENARFILQTYQASRKYFATRRDTPPFDEFHLTFRFVWDESNGRDNIGLTQASLINSN